MNKRILSVVMSVLLTVIAILFLQNEKVVDAADNLVLLEKRHPGYWTWLRERASKVDIDNDKEPDVVAFPISKKYLPDITLEDYKFFLKDTERDSFRRLVYFLDGTGVDMDTSLYGDVDSDSWTVKNGTKVDNFDAIRHEEKTINEITDLYEYLDALKGYSFVISVRDDAHTHWDETLQQLLEGLGLSGGFEYRDSYIAVVDNEGKVYETVGEPIAEYKGVFQGHDLSVRSSGYNNGAISEIVIDGIDYSQSGRGLNIVVLKDGDIVDSVNFDTWYWALTCYR